MKNFSKNVLNIAFLKIILLFDNLTQKYEKPHSSKYGLGACTF